MPKQQTVPVKRALTDTEKLLITRIAAMLSGDVRRQTLLDDMAGATAEVFATEGALRIVFYIKGYERPPYRGQHSFGVEGKLNDSDGELLTTDLFADENDRLLELEIVRYAYGPIKAPDWHSLVLY